MKTTIVPAQITSIEDKIGGNLTLHQLVLLMTPAFVAMITFIAMPSSMHVSAAKIALDLICLAVCAILALRVSGTLLFDWFVIYVNYVIRPHFYVFNKNHRDSTSNGSASHMSASEAFIDATSTQQVERLTQYRGRKALFASSSSYNPRNTNLNFRSTRKGVLQVVVTDPK